MSHSSPESYPGSTASFEEIFKLAEVYYRATVLLSASPQRGEPLSYAPLRLCAIHAVELYLNAFLRQKGVQAEQIRARLHNLADQHFVDTLSLRRKTAEHLRQMTEKREYLISRYAPELASQLSELTRLMATLTEVRKKLAKHLEFQLEGND